MVLKFDIGTSAGGLAALIGIVAAIVYFRAVFRREAKPNRATWWILSAVGIIVATSYYFSGARNTMALAVVYALIPLSVAIVSIKYGEGGCSRFDLACLFTAGISLLLWWLSETPLVTLLTNLSIDFAGLLPTIRKSFRRPQSESRTAWTLALVASILSLFAIERWKFSIAIYPIYLVATNGIIVAMLWIPSAKSRAATSRSITRIFFNAILLIVLFGSRKVAAGPVDLPVEKISSADSEKNPWTGDTGFNFVSAFFAYGLLAENQGVIAEPFLDVNYTAIEVDGLVSKVTLGLQLWSSLHSAGTDATKNNPVPWWYEFDYYLPVGVTITKDWTLTGTYLDYEFLGGAFAAQRAVEGTISYDDSHLLGLFALHPHALLLYNFQGVLGVARTAAWYGEVGVSPGLSLAAKSNYPVTVIFPVIVGVGDRHFYPVDAYGFFSATVNGSVPLAFLPKSMGGWSANAGFTYLNLGASAVTLNANQDHNAYIWQIGLSKDF